MPVNEPTVAIVVFALLQIPPPVASGSVLVNPGHTFKTPVIPTGNGLTTTVVVFVTEQPEPDALMLRVYAPAILKIALSVTIVSADIELKSNGPLQE